MNEVVVSFPGGKRVDAQIGSLIVRTDQPVESGGENSAVAPFELFLASLATCAGFYAMAFCQARNLPTEGLKLRQTMDVDSETHLAKSIRIELTLPEGFPEKYRVAIVRAAEGCKVKKTIAALPTIEVIAVG